MSHERDRHIELRAIVAIAAICALAFGLLVSGGSYRSRGDASMHAASSDARHATCHDYSSDVTTGKTPDGGQKSKGDCPCCLAAHAAPAVLPERSGVLTRLERTASPVLYLAQAPTPPRLALPHSINGARAPPRGFAIS